MNSVNLTGRLTRDVELQTTQGNDMTAKFTIAVDGFKKDDTSFIMCRAWGKVAQSLADYMHKGSLIGVSGRLRTYRYEKDGQTVYGYEVVADKPIDFLDSRNADNDNNYHQNRNNNGYRNNNHGHNNNAHGYNNNNHDYNQQPPKSPVDDDITHIDDEDLPF